MVKKFVISSGHGKIVRGASGYIDEVDEARKVVNKVYEILTESYNGEGYKFHDDTSKTQTQNLATIVNYHNSKIRDLDISVHFNSATPSATGTECLYYDAKNLSSKMSKAMANSLNITDRGAKVRQELYFLNSTKKTAILLEVCFVSNKSDANKYVLEFKNLCDSISLVIAEELGYTKKITTVSKPKEPVTTNKDEYYTSNPGTIKVIKECWQYNNTDFVDKNKVQKVKADSTKYTVDKIVKTKAGTPRLLMKNGTYMTANKKYVKKA